MVSGIIKFKSVGDNTKMSRKTVIILFLCAMTCSTGDSSDVCPGDCTCTDTASGLDINCNAKDLTEVPLAIKSITGKIKKIGLAANKIKSVAADAFGTISCRDIILGNNKDIIINSHAFRGVKGLENIILSDCNLKSLPGDFFLDVPSLKMIYLMNNPQFTSTALEAFGRSQKPPNLKEINLDGCGVTQVAVHDPCLLSGTKIILADNSIHCDCNLHTLIKSNTVSFEGICATPSEFKGLSVATPPIPGEKGYFSATATKSCQVCADADKSISFDCKEGKVWYDGKSYESSEYKNIPCPKPSSKPGSESTSSPESSAAILKPAYFILVLVGLVFPLYLEV